MRLAWGVSLLAVAAPVAAQPIDDSALPDIVVTAQRRQESLRDVPIAVSAFDAARIEARAIDDGRDLQFFVPNLILVGNERPTLRGIGNNAISSTAENGVPVFFNESAIGSRAENEFYDLERVEVLRGPQGTLFGRNTTGGAIVVVTRKPDEDFGGELFGEYGNFNSVRLRGAVNVPVSDALQLRFAGLFIDRDGYTENLSTGNAIDGRHQWSLRGSARLRLGEATEANLVVQYYKEDSSRTRENKRLCKATPVMGCSPTELGFDSPDANATVLQSLLRLFTGSIFPVGGNIYAGAPNPTDLRKVAADTDSTFKGDELLATLNITHDFGDYQLTSLTGYGEGSSEANTDYDNADLPFRFLVPITYTFAEGQTVTTDRLLTTDSFRGKGRTWTQEVRLTSDRGGMFDFTVGGFYLNSRSSAAFIIWHPSLELAANAFGLPPESRIFINETPRATTESWALFGETYFRLSERTRITLGGRYTWDDKSIQTRSILLAPPPPFIEASRSWQRFTGRVAIDHRLSDDSLVYASFAHGYKGGGLNPGNSGTPDFDPETVNAIEFGFKNRFLNGTLSANFAGFWYDYKGLQLAQRTGTQAVTSNADARVWGLEAEMVAAPARGLTFDLNLAYLNTRIRDFVTVDAGNPAQVDPRFQPPARTPVVAINLDGNRLPYAPDFKIQLGAQYVFDLGSSGWRATLRSDYVLQDEYYAREFNTVNDRIESWSVLNAFVRLDAPDRRFTLEGWVKNITDADNITNSIIEDATVGSYRNVRVLEPRTFGISGTFRF